jgi:hypothetical protein
MLRASATSTWNEAAHFGPELPFPTAPDAALQLHQTGHSCVVQHFRGMKVGNADKADLIASSLASHNAPFTKG